MAVTMKDIAEHCGVSAGAVSQVLRDPEHPRFRPETRKLILDAAESLGYRGSLLSRALRTNRTNLIGLMLPWNEPEVMDEIERIADEHGYKLLLQFTASPSAQREYEALQFFLEWHVDGIIWEPSNMTDDDFSTILAKIRKEETPLVMLERVSQEAEFPLVTTDFAPVFEECVVHLKEKNYKRIVFAFTNEREGPFAFENKREGTLEEKIKGLQEASLRHGLEFSTLVLWAPKTDFMRQIQETFSQTDSIDTCYICYSWTISDFVDAAEAVQLRIPEDIGLVMFHDLLIGGRLRVSNLLRPKISAIRVDGTTLAKLAVEKLVNEINNKNSGKKHLKNKAEFVIQDSTNRK